MMEFDSLLKPIFIEGLQKVTEWYRADSEYFLRSIFDLVGFRKRDENESQYFVLPSSLSVSPTYPVKGDREKLNRAKKEVVKEIDEKHKGFSGPYLAALSANQLFFLLEKFGGCVPFDDKEKTCVFDIYKIRAAQAVIQDNREKLGHQDNLLINVDLSGIQRFIYNVSSTGALKNLRARSFFIELLCNHIVSRVLMAYNLHSANVLMNGGGTIYILSGSSGSPDESEKELDAVSDSINSWLLKEFDGALYAAFSYVRSENEALKGNLVALFDKLALKAFDAKQTKFKSLIEKQMFEFIEVKDPDYTGCEMCKRDGPGTIYYPTVEDEERKRCSLCHRLSRLGSKIPRTRFIYESDKETDDCLKIEETYYLLSDTNKNEPCVFVVYEEGENFLDELKDETIPIFTRTFIRINKELPKDVYIEIERERERVALLLSSTQDEEGRKNLQEDIETLKDENTATMEYIAQASAGAKYVAALRMDADNVGKILHSGYRDGTSLEGISSFSRNLNYFFKLYLGALCRDGFKRDAAPDILSIKEGKGRNVHVIYAGGDDLFTLGAWSDTACLAMDIGDAFKKYTCDNIDLGLSGGLTVHNDRFPVSKMADESMDGLTLAKKNRQPCWMCLDNWVECPLYDIGNCLRKDSMTLFYSGYMAFKKKRLDDKHRPTKYSPETSRLKLSLKWKRYDTETKVVVNEVNDYIIEPLKAFRLKGSKVSRVFFHNVLALLDAWYDEGLLYMPRIAWILQKFRAELKKHVTEGGEGETLYDLYDMHLHLHDSTRFSTLYLPLTWNILLSKGENQNED